MVKYFDFGRLKRTYQQIRRQPAPPAPQFWGEKRTNSHSYQVKPKFWRFRCKGERGKGKVKTARVPKRAPVERAASSFVPLASEQAGSMFYFQVQREIREKNA